MVNVANAWTPPVSEKKSTNKPNKKQRNKTKNLFSFNGKAKTKAMYKYGFINPKRLILFSINTCKSSKKKNRNMFL